LLIASPILVFVRKQGSRLDKSAGKAGLSYLDDYE
jgi:hypothetical protein